MRYFLLLFIVLLVVGCSTKRPEGNTEAEVLYREAKEFMEDGRYLLATEKLNTIRSKHPYSYYATHAELMMADILYKQENFPEAAAAYILFKDFHPKNEKIPYVVWKIAESYFNQLPSTYDRDLSAAFEAIKYYNMLATSYPDSEYMKEAGQRISKCEKLIQDKEQYIADFYFKTKVYDAAVFRYNLILQTFNDKKLRDHAMERIIASNFHLKSYKECSEKLQEYQHLVSSETRKVIQVYADRCKN